MQLIYISDSTFPSRTANSIQVLKMCQAFIQKGCTVSLFAPFSLPSKPRLTPVFWYQYGIKNPIRIKFFPRINLFRYYDYFLLAVIRAKILAPDVIFTRTVIVAFLSCFLRIPTILELHSPPSGFLSPLFFRLFLRSRTKRRLVSISSALMNS